MNYNQGFFMDDYREDSFNNDFSQGQQENRRHHKGMCCVNTVCCYPTNWDCDCENKNDCWNDNKKDCKGKRPCCDCRQNWWFDRCRDDNFNNCRNRDFDDDKRNCRDDKQDCRNNQKCRQHRCCCFCCRGCRW